MNDQPPIEEPTGFTVLVELQKAANGYRLKRGAEAGRTAWDRMEGDSTLLRLGI